MVFPSRTRPFCAHSFLGAMGILARELYVVVLAVLYGGLQSPAEDALLGLGSRW